ncbi:transposase [Paracoccus liaowanqingii]|uniref:Transposase n=1 Tax=Paracoccus liaowanqingii TaxID=2560053 RepID=A0A4P7HNP7_9RHOB|nr:transposase [Paracoccus liaowanqingii]
MARLRALFPRSHGRPRIDDLRVLSGLIVIDRNGSPWFDAPKEDGPAKTLYHHRKRWSDNGASPGSWWAWPPSVGVRPKDRTAPKQC